MFHSHAFILSHQSSANRVQVLYSMLSHHTVEVGLLGCNQAGDVLQSGARAICYPAGSFSGRCPGVSPPRRWNPCDSRWNSTRCVRAGWSRRRHTGTSVMIVPKKIFANTPSSPPAGPHAPVCSMFSFHFVRCVSPPSRLARGVCSVSAVSDGRRDIRLMTDSLLPFR